MQAGRLRYKEDKDTNQGGNVSLLVCLGLVGL
jgi:hypothetical protein